MDIENPDLADTNQPEQAANYRNVCRTCFKELDTQQEVVAEFSQISLLLFSTFQFKQKIPDSENDPDKVCMDCKMFVENSYSFKQKFQEIQSFLKKLKDLPEEVAIDSSQNTLDKDCQTDQTTIYCCEQCNSKFLDHAMLKSHRAIHGTDKFKCGRCEKHYTRLSYLQQHIAVSHPDYCNMNTKLVAFVNLCDICNKQFSRKDHLKTHLRNVHKQRIKVVNPVVLKKSADNLDETLSEEEFGDFDEEFDPTENLDVKIKEEFDENDSDLEELDNHEEINEILSDEEEDEKPSFENLEDIDIKVPKIEIKTEENEEIACENPEKSVKSERRSKRDRERDKDNKRHECQTCKKTFTRATHLKRHILTHSDIKPFQCKICEKRFTRSDHLNLHMIHHSDTKPFECDVCKKGFVRMEHLKKHKDSQHNKDEDGNDLVKKEYCPVCNKGFRTPKYLQIHMKSHSAEPKSLNCKYCDQEFLDRAQLNQHSKDVHAQFEKPFLCSECGLRFVRNDYLVIHMRRHRGEKPYKCRFCGKGFPRATDLTVHERYHTNEKTHLCTTCGKGFQRAYNLLVHMRVHTGEKPYHCPHCIKSFAQGNDLKAHIRRHTGERYKCEICGDGFIQGYHLTHHKRSVHGLDVKSHIRRVEKFVTPQSQEQQINALKTGDPVPQPILTQQPNENDLIVSEVKVEQFSVMQGPIMAQNLPLTGATEPIPIENMMTIHQFVQQDQN